SPILIHHGVDTGALRIHYDDCSGVMTERFNRSLAHFEIFADGIVLGDVLLNFIAHAFVDRALASNRRLATLLGAATSQFEIAPVTALELPHLSGEFPLTQFVTRAFLQLRDVG